MFRYLSLVHLRATLARFESSIVQLPASNPSHLSDVIPPANEDPFQFHLFDVKERLGHTSAVTRQVPEGAWHLRGLEAH
jgi:hypothetical protein